MKERGKKTGREGEREKDRERVRDQNGEKVVALRNMGQPPYGVQ